MKILKILFFICFFIAALLAFLPKKNLYYYGEEKLAGLKTVIVNERLSEGMFSLYLEHADIYVEDIRAAKVMEAEVVSYLVSTSLQARHIRLSGMAKNFLPTRIETFTMRYDLLHPLTIKFTASGEFGTATGEYLLESHKFEVRLRPSKTMQSDYREILQRMKKAKNGEYRYEERF